MTKKYKYAIYIGRFSPFHNGHLHTLMEGFKIAENVIVLVGSSYQPRTPKNPWSFRERADMIYRAVPHKDYRYRLNIGALIDYRYDDNKWASEVQRQIKEINHDAEVGLHATNDEIVLIGHDKDASSYYLKMFPQWDFIDTGLGHSIDATNIRELYFNGCLPFVENLMHSSNYEWIKNWAETDAYKRIKAEHIYIHGYKAQWPAKIYVTTDVVVVQSGHVLMIERGKDVGVGLLALPGGFLNEDERVIDGALRELEEETKIKVPEKVLRGSIRHQQVFDAPGRDLRGRIITHAVLIKLDDSQPLPKVKGSDDARRAWWFPISELQENRERIYGDHADIVDNLLGKL
jgi:bifunctional NMN adenylyltransferase/nudix hydrolase